MSAIDADMVMIDLPPQIGAATAASSMLTAPCRHHGLRPDRASSHRAVRLTQSTETTDAQG